MFYMLSCLMWTNLRTIIYVAHYRIHPWKCQFRSIFYKPHLFLLELKADSEVELEEEARGERPPVGFHAARCAWGKRQVHSQDATSFLQ